MRIIDNVYPSQMMEDTQAIDWDIEEEEETEQSCESLGCNLEPVGRLHIFSGAHGPEKGQGVLDAEVLVQVFCFWGKVFGGLHEAYICFKDMWIFF